MRINEIWNEMENDKSLSSGLLLRRYAPTVMPDVYVALRQPEKLHCIALCLYSKIQINLSRYSNLKDISLELIPDESDRTKQYLLVLLLFQQHKDVFATLCEDLIYGIGNITEESIVVRELLNRLEKWKSLFDRAGLQGLSPEEQRGIFGELYFLRKWLTHSSDTLRCIEAWLGPEKDLRDFQLTNWGIEVKTTHSNNHQKLHISSERQLDTTNLNTLLLYHLSLETQQQNGETLNQIVDSINDLLSTDLAAQTLFRSKLLQSGYYIHHRPNYDRIGYHVRQEFFYNIREDFPRIEENDIRNGVGDVKYSIIISDQSAYVVDESSVIEIINQNG